MTILRIPPAGRVRKDAPTYPAVNMVAAAIIAFRTNSNKMERADLSESDSFWVGGVAAQVDGPVVSNKTRMLTMLRQGEPIPEDVLNEAAELMQTLQSDMTMKLLTGKTVSDFTKDLIASFDLDCIPESKVGIVAYAPNVYAQLMAKAAIVEQTAEFMYTSKPIGTAGQKVALTFTLIEKKYIQKINCFSAFGSDEHGNLIQFLTADEGRCQSGKITGKVKESGADRYHNNATVTNLNFVKQMS